MAQLLEVHSSTSNIHLAQRPILFTFLKNVRQHLAYI